MAVPPLGSCRALGGHAQTVDCTATECVCVRRLTSRAFTRSLRLPASTRACLLGPPAIELVEEVSISARLGVLGGDFLDDAHERLGHVAAAVLTEVSAEVGVVIGAIGDAATVAASSASAEGAISDCGARIRVQATGVGAPLSDSTVITASPVGSWVSSCSRSYGVVG